jgi:trk system potassium uptake protein TrkA
MKIIILGAGQVGSSVAQNLASEANDITVVDNRPEILRDLQDRIDIRTVTGPASHPEVLTRAGAKDADMILAVTNSDETNMIACQVAYTLFHTPIKVARVRAQEYLAYPKLFTQEALPVDVLISPEQLVTDYIRRLIEQPEALQVLEFAGGRVQLVAVRAVEGGPLVGQELRELRSHMPGIEARVAAIFRSSSDILPKGDTVIEANDEVFFIAARKNIRAVTSELRGLDKPVKRVMIAGGGNIGLRLAKSIESRYQVKLIDRNPETARRLSEQLDSAIVLLGDAADEELLLDENIENTDIFCALTNDEEANILSAMLAKRLGARKVMSLINRPSYVDLVQSEAVHSLRRGAAEAIEAVAHGDNKTSKVVGRAVDEIKLPPGTTIGAIVRGEDVIVAHHNTVIESDDHVILFLVDKQHIPAVERLFQVGVTFF